MIRRQKQYANNSTYRNGFSQRLKQEDCGARAMAQQLGALVALSEDPGLVPSTLLVAQTNFNSIFQGSESSSKL